jgi:hypothetical protein
MKVTREFKENFDLAIAHYGCTPAEVLEMKACITEATLADADRCFTEIAARIRTQSQAGGSNHV